MIFASQVRVESQTRSRHLSDGPVGQVRAPKSRAWSPIVEVSCRHGWIRIGGLVQDAPCERYAERRRCHRRRPQHLLAPAILEQVPRTSTHRMSAQSAGATTKEGRRKGEGRHDEKGYGGAEKVERLFFTGANFETSEQRLRSFFAAAGQVEKVVLFRLDGARSAGMGHVVYATREGALNALATLHNRVLEGAPVTLKATGMSEQGAVDRERVPRGSVGANGGAEAQRSMSSSAPVQAERAVVPAGSGGSSARRKAGKGKLGAVSLRTRLLHGERGEKEEEEESPAAQQVSGNRSAGRGAREPRDSGPLCSELTIVVPRRPSIPPPGLELLCGSQEPHSLLGNCAMEEGLGEFRRLSSTRASLSTRASSSSALAPPHGAAPACEVPSGEAPRQCCAERGGRRGGGGRGEAADPGRMPRPWKAATARVEAARRLAFEAPGCGWGGLGSQGHSAGEGPCHSYTAWDDPWYDCGQWGGGAHIVFGCGDTQLSLVS
ncbi:unnamed protein product [Prorocentrum cordatum]|uniref:RRM domain-containing protein n=1 Tax=Prorocentrum cordatum TaxID=2364126 RepID=A0ABN9PBS7_9DINO|nr:unnamed protein product [Polarella glacialis]